MGMNTQHLQYIIEIERTRSISQAAENLFLGQPNLSRILHDMEQSLGFRIFERTSRGVRPTERGAKFLKHARNMLREMDYIEALGPRNAVPNRLRVCIPRSAKLFEATAEYIASLNPECDLDARILECHARRTLEILSSGEAEIGVIRFRAEYRDYFEEQTVQRELSLQILSKYRYKLILPQEHPLAAQAAIRLCDLEGFAEIVHGDNLRTHGKQQNVACRKIYTVDRLAQLTLLQTLPGAYMWGPEMPEKLLAQWGLVQRPCQENQTVYHNAIILHPRYAMTEIESGYVQHIMQRCK